MIKIYTLLLLLLGIFTINNAKLQRMSIYKHENFKKTLDDVRAEKNYLIKKHQLLVNDVKDAGIDELDTVNLLYYSYIYVGNPAQTISVSFDTYHAMAIFPNGNATQAGFTSALSSTYVPVDIPYADYVDVLSHLGSIMLNHMGQDDVQVADMTLQSQIIFLSDAPFTKTHYQGIFGLGVNYTALDGRFQPPMKTMILQGLIDEELFSMYLIEKHPSMPAFGGEVILGGSDPTLFNGPLKYIPLTDATQYNVFIDLNWAIALDSVTMLGETLSSNHVAVIDSGTNLIGCPALPFALINRQLKGTLDNNGNYIVDCSKIDSFPNIVFNIAGNTINLLPSTYILKVFGPEGEKCMSAFAIASDTVKWILGTPFLVQNYFEFDMKNQRIGYAPIIPPTVNEPAPTPVPEISKLLPKKVCQ